MVLTIGGMRFYTTADAAVLLGITPGSLRNGLSGGWIRLTAASKLGAQNLFRAEDVEREVRRRAGL